MIVNLAEYFKPEQSFYLERIAYNRIDKADGQNAQKAEYTLNCLDNIEALLQEDGIKLSVTRTLKFDPEELFELVVSFGAVVFFDEKKKNDYNWNEVDLADEFRRNGEFVTGNLMHRISLLIAEITASYGQAPLVLPPVLAEEER